MADPITMQPLFVPGEAVTSAAVKQLVVKPLHMSFHVEKLWNHLQHYINCEGIMQKSTSLTSSLSFFTELEEFIVFCTAWFQINNWINNLYQILISCRVLRLTSFTIPRELTSNREKFVSALRAHIRKGKRKS